MESIDNQNSRSLRVMRFSFEANENLQDELEQELVEKRQNVAPLAIYASRQFMTPPQEYYRREVALLRIAKTFSENRGLVELKPSIRSKQIDKDTTRFQLLPKDQQAFDAMTSLDAIPDKRVDNYDPRAPIEKLVNAIEGQPNTGHYLFFDVATDSLLSAHQRTMAEHSFSHKAAAGRFWLHTGALNVVKDIHYTIKLPQAESVNGMPVDESELAETA